MQARTMTEKILQAHALDDENNDVLALKPAQVLLQDATGTLVMQALEAIGLDQIQVDLAVQYVDHNLMQADFRNADDHSYLRSCASAFGIWFAEPGEGVSHPVHAERFGRPGALILGSDSHTCAAGALGMIGIGAGSFDIAAVLAGERFHLKQPKVRQITLTGTLPRWVGAKDAILTLLGRYGVAGAKGYILEYDGPGVKSLGVMDRMAIANMGAEMGATASVFPSDDRTRKFLEHFGRGNDWEPLSSDPAANYDDSDKLDLSTLEPMIARPSSPDDVVPVRSVVGEPVGQAYIGSSANPGYSDIANVAALLAGRAKSEGVSLDINPATRSALMGLVASGQVTELLMAGARFHQIGCNGCNGMGQAPGSGVNSLRTVPRNFPGRSGSIDDRVWLCGPETAAAAALTGQITDPRDVAPESCAVAEFPTGKVFSRLIAPKSMEKPDIIRGANIAFLKPLEPIRGRHDLPILLRLGDDISTDAISPAGAEALPLRSNPEKLADFTFRRVDPDYVSRARAVENGHVILAGHNMGQGSSREHATLCPKLLGLKAVFAFSFARIFHANLINVGILPLILTAPMNNDFALAEKVVVDFDAVEPDAPIQIDLGHKTVTVRHQLTERDCATLLVGGLLAKLSKKHCPT